MTNDYGHRTIDGSRIVAESAGEGTGDVCIRTADGRYWHSTNKTRDAADTGETIRTIESREQS